MGEKNPTQVHGLSGESVLFKGGWADHATFGKLAFSIGAAQPKCLPLAR